jgi:glycosyltransferase involved in cell wall biosynthesis
VRDLPLALAAILVGRSKGIPVIVDMAEPYPLTLRQRLEYEPFTLSHLVTRNVFFADVLERIVIRKANHILTVCEEAKDRLVAIGANARNTSIIRNTPDLTRFTPIPASYPGVLEKLRGNFILLYVGIIIGGRGIECAIKAMKEVVDKQPRIKLVIVGDGKQEESMRIIVRSEGLEDSVYFEGWVDNAKIPDYIASCDLGVLPFANTSHINHTLANKIFDFMAMRKPILCSDVKPMKRIIEETNSGYLFKTEDHNDLAQKILKCFAANDLGLKGEWGFKSVRDKYNWSIDGKQLNQIVLNITT